MRLGPQARCAHRNLSQRITAGLLPPARNPPPQAELAPALGVSLLTLRQALDQLEQEGLIASEHGRGTFVRAPTPPTVLILEDDAVQRALLSAHVEAAGYPVVAVSGPQEGLEALEQTPSIALALSDLRMPTAAEGLTFICTVHQRWPALPLVVVTAYPDDLTPLQGRPEHPVLILTKPVVASQIAQV